MHKLIKCVKGHYIHLHTRQGGRISKVANFTGDYCCIRALADELRRMRGEPQL